MNIREIGALQDVHSKGWAAAMGRLFHADALPFLRLMLHDYDENCWKHEIPCPHCRRRLTVGDDTLQARFGRACLKALQERRPEFLRHVADMAEWWKNPHTGWTALERMIAVSEHFSHDRAQPSAAVVREICWRMFRWDLSPREIRRWFKLLGLPLKRERRPRAPRSKPG